MKIGILKTGRTPDELIDEHGDYDAFFKRLLAGRGFEFITYDVLSGVLPASSDEAEGWLITGSKHGVYEKLDWIAKLEDFLREAFAAGRPIIGVCFGHQILAQALGGKVEKFSGGWSVGPTSYQDAQGEDQTIIAWHQDQVVERPVGAKVIGSSEFCENAILAYGDIALTIQPHPEFTADFMAGLLEARRGILPDSVVLKAQERQTDVLTSLDYAAIFEDFFKRKRQSS